MIIPVYLTVGKSTLAKNRLDVVDLETSCFDKSNPNWYIDYCRTALYLEKQGYIVLVSICNWNVLDYLIRFNKNNIVCIFYNNSLKNYIITKSLKRNDSSRTFNFINQYETWYNKIVNWCSKNKIRYEEINDENYSLEDIINNIILNNNN